MDKKLEDYLEYLDDNCRYTYNYTKGLKLNILNNEIILFKECECLVDDCNGSIIDSNCDICKGKGYILSEEGHQLLRFVEAIPLIKEFLGNT